MRRPATDRTLRRIVAELATTTDEDVDAVLAQLDERHRGAVRTLLADYLGEVGRQASPQPAAATRDLDGLSPWLRFRIDPRDPSTASRNGAVASTRHGQNSRDAMARFSMTPAALEALRASAQALPADLLSPPKAEDEDRGRFDFLGARLLRGGGW